MLLICAFLAIVLYGWWATVPGHHPSQFECGTRLLPVAATALVLIVLNVLPWSWGLRLPIIVALYGLLVANVCFVARVRDFS